MEYGLIGNPLKHSFSKEVHGLISNYNYELCELDEKDFTTFMNKKDFKAINVTIPYKKMVIPYLDYIDIDAKNMGAVNTIVNVNGKLKGYNTDVLGVISTFNKFNLDVRNKNILILGTGATSNTVHYAINKLCDTTNSHSKVLKAYRESSKVKGDILYSNISKVYDDINIIINTTSNGMYPHANDEPLVDISKFKNLEGVMDVVYNPLRTRLLIESENNDIHTLSGLYMLTAQAIFANIIFNNNDENIVDTIKNDIFLNKNTSSAKEKCNTIYEISLKNKLNIVLTGMPSCGKSTIGKILSKKYNYEFIDTDTLIEEKINCPISDFILKNGEKSFRGIESEVINEISTKNHTVISTGGGAILDDKNVTNLKYNGKIFFINRSLKNLKPTSDRPLTSDIESLTSKYNERLPIYKRTCDEEIDGDLELDEKIDIIMSKI